MGNKYKKFEKKHLDTMVIEIDITKCEKTFREIMELIEKIEDDKLSTNKLAVKDIYWK